MGPWMFGPRKSEPEPTPARERKGCLCGCEDRAREQRALRQLAFRLWTLDTLSAQAQQDPDDWSYADAVLRAKQDRSIHDEEVNFMREKTPLPGSDWTDPKG